MEANKVEKTYICDRCGATVKVGDFPFCRGSADDHDGGWRGAEEPMEAHYDEMLSTDGETFTSMRAKVRFMDKHAIVPKETPYTGKRRQYFDLKGR
jgi:hypothetical protein